MIVGVPKEQHLGERRVALVPLSMAPLKKAGFEVLLEPGAGVEAGFADQAFVDAGASVAASRADLFSKSDVVVQVRSFGADPAGWEGDLKLAKEGQALIGTMDPLSSPEPFRQAAGRKVITFALELIPRITRAQAMDVLSSQANLAGYKAVLMAADALPKIFPMMMTAAGTITPSRVLVVGAGVAGLQAIATAKRLGSVVSGYDVRPAVKEQVESLGARFVELPLETAEGEGGYARQMDEAFYKRQAELMAAVVAENDVVITTAAIPGQKAPVLVTTAMVEGMRAGSVIVDLAAERGGNCELTQPGQNVQHKGVTIMGPLNLPSAVPYHASQLYAKNVATFLMHIAKGGQIGADAEDEIYRETVVTRDGEVVNARVRERLGMDAVQSPTT